MSHSMIGRYFRALNQVDFLRFEKGCIVWGEYDTCIKMPSSESRNGVIYIKQPGE